jgi:hypothetical protein
MQKECQEKERNKAWNTGERQNISTLMGTSRFPPWGQLQRKCFSCQISQACQRFASDTETVFDSTTCDWKIPSVILHLLSRTSFQRSWWMYFKVGCCIRIDSESICIILVPASIILYFDDYHLLGDDAVGVISQKMIIIIVTAVETSNLTSCILFNLYAICRSSAAAESLVSFV